MALQEERVARLTTRQRECLRRIHLRFSMKEIAADLGIAPSVVKDHLDAARERLGGLPSAAAAARALAEIEGVPDPLTRSPPPKPVSDTIVPEAPPPTEGRVDAGSLRDSATASPYAAESMRTIAPLDADRGDRNELDWHAKLLRALMIALASAWLLGSIMAMLR